MAISKCTVFQLIAICLIHTLAIEAKNGHHVLIENLNITTDPEYLTFNVTMRRENDTNVFDMVVDMFKDIGSDTFIENEIFAKSKAENDFQSFIKGTPIDVCVFFDNPEVNPPLNLVLMALVKYGFQMSSCPLIKTQSNIIGFRLDYETLPSITPEGIFRIEIVLTRLVGGIYKPIYTIDCDFSVEKV